MPFLNKLHAEFVPGQDNIKLVGPLDYFDNRSDQLFVIPKGFTCDGASIPKFLWSVLGHPFRSDVRCAAILHDFLYRNAVVKRKVADQMFYDAMIESGCEIAKAQTLHAGVRFGAGDVYKKYKRERKGLS